jgi:hypothetical protein
MADDVIGAAMDLQMTKGPGLLDSIYGCFNVLKLTGGASQLILPGAYTR